MYGVESKCEQAKSNPWRNIVTINMRKVYVGGFSVGFYGDSPNENYFEIDESVSRGDEVYGRDFLAGF